MYLPPHRHFKVKFDLQIMSFNLTDSANLFTAYVNDWSSIAKYEISLPLRGNETGCPLYERRNQ